MITAVTVGSLTQDWDDTVATLRAGLNGLSTQAESYAAGLLAAGRNDWEVYRAPTEHFMRTVAATEATLQRTRADLAHMHALNVPDSTRVPLARAYADLVTLNQRLKQEFYATTAPVASGFNQIGVAPIIVALIVLGIGVTVASIAYAYVGGPQADAQLLQARTQAAQTQAVIDDAVKRGVRPDFTGVQQPVNLNAPAPPDDDASWAPWIIGGVLAAGLGYVLWESAGGRELARTSRAVASRVEQHYTAK